MRYVTISLILSSTLAASVLPTDAMAQVPPHYPGTLCFTPQFWCWAAQAGPVGTPCGCPSAYGWIAGRLG
jgi:hypothetical protein